MKWIAILCLTLMACIASAQSTDSLRLMTWNIWHGGRENGHFSGPRQIINVIQEQRADVVMLQETYGSGELIARGLKYHFQPRGTNVSILSRFPIEEDISVFEPFKCVGAIVKLPNGKKIAVYSIWLPYGEDIWIPEIRAKFDVAGLLNTGKPSVRDVEKALQLIQDRLSDSKYSGIPVIFGGDFNSMSHLDYAEVGREHYQLHVPWITSRIMTSAGYRDSYREVIPDVNRAKDRTWSPRFPEQEQERIDFIYYKGGGLEPVEAKRVDSTSGLFPSDHAAVVVEMNLKPHPVPKDIEIRAATYNIRHGAGMDDKLDLIRTAQAIRNLKADIVALQELDDRTKRTGGVNQVAELGRQLNMHPAFGSFMSFDGGWYGLGMLSRYPIVNVMPFRLVDGNEPRVALVVELRLPNGEITTVVNVHFDWVEDDGFRFAQAKSVHDLLKTISHPTILLGDFNDLRDTRTLNLFSSTLTEVQKAKGKEATFPASKPDKEIDFIFVSPTNRWRFRPAQVVGEKLASDHRPVLAQLRLVESK